jgi:RNA polymerase sigma-70 factor, ECF subfamily
MRIEPPPATKGSDEKASPGDAVSSAIAAEILIDPHAAGDARASFDQIYDEHVDFVWRSARRLGVDEDAADDVVQQVFVVVYRRLREFEGRAAIKTWLFAILLRVAQDYRRTLRRKNPHLSSEPADPDLVADETLASSPYESLSRTEASRLILHLLDSLEDDRRVVFVMAELEQMTPAEIAAALSEDVKVIYSRLRGARADFEQAAARLRKRTMRGEQL